MMVESESAATQLISAWGAVSGTIALAIKASEWRRERYNLDVLAEVRADGVRPVARVDWKVVVRNRGRRPISVARIELMLGRFGRTKRIQLRELRDPIELTEGTARTLTFSCESNVAPIDMHKVAKLVVVDATGKRWATAVVDGAKEILSVRPTMIKRLPDGTMLRRYESHGYHIVAMNSAEIDGARVVATVPFQSSATADHAFGSLCEDNDTREYLSQYGNGNLHVVLRDFNSLRELATAARGSAKREEPYSYNPAGH